MIDREIPKSKPPSTFKPRLLKILSLNILDHYKPKTFAGGIAKFVVGGTLVLLYLISFFAAIFVAFGGIVYLIMMGGLYSIQHHSGISLIAIVLSVLLLSFWKIMKDLK